MIRKIAHKNKTVEKMLRQRLRELLPTAFRLYLRILSVADQETKELECSLAELSMNFDLNSTELFYWLNFLDELRFVSFEIPDDIFKKVKIKALV